MNFSKSGIAAWIVVLLTPVALAFVTLYRWKTGPCAGVIHGSVWFLMVGAACLVMAKVEYFAIAACLSYFPVGYTFATDGCRIARSHQLPIEWLSPFFYIFILVGTLVLGAILHFVFANRDKYR